MKQRNYRQTPLYNSQKVCRGGLCYEAFVWVHTTCKLFHNGDNDHMHGLNAFDRFSDMRITTQTLSCKNKQLFRNVKVRWPSTKVRVFFSGKSEIEENAVLTDLSYPHIVHSPNSARLLYRSNGRTKKNRSGKFHEPYTPGRCILLAKFIGTKRIIQDYSKRFVHVNVSPGFVSKVCPHPNELN